ncbi:uncharacterized protein LOC109415939 [Aedes albopictus]|uniref:Uncharacterized protein n=1 Tax=Aedes albopictus TaxID=7160 RepID=A0ABM1YGD5_AEDAL
MFMKKLRRIIKAKKYSMEEYTDLASEIQTTFFEENIEMTDRTIYVAFSVLPYMLRQMFVQKGLKKSRPSVLMCKESFITTINTEAKLAETVEKRRKTATENKTRVQPYIVVVQAEKALQSFFVVFDFLIFKANCMLAAVDLHFKLHAVFNLEYSELSTNVMIFIQKYFYNLSYKNQRVVSSVAALISDLDRA